MRLWAGLLICTLLPAVWAAPPEDAYRGADFALLAAIRTGFETAPQSPEQTRDLLAQLEARRPADPADWPAVFQAYHAALTGLAGKHSSRPWDKYRRAKAGIAGFQGLIEAHPDSVELRLLRFSFGHGLPGFFDTADQAAADRAALVRLLERNDDPTLPPDFRLDTIRWILANGDPTPGERARLESLLPPPDDNR